MLSVSPMVAAPAPFGWPASPEQTFYCLRLHVAGVRAHVCCYRQVRKRRYKARETAKESMYPSCTVQCPQGMLIRLAMPRGYDPAAYQKEHGLKRRIRVRGFCFPDSLPFGSEPFESAGPRTWGRGPPAEPQTCPACGHARGVHRGAYYNNCIVEDCDCPGFGGRF